ncbi:hypothetical protein ABPG74_012396 [Tetrahymena malaccensis]
MNQVDTLSVQGQSGHLFNQSLNQYHNKLNDSENNLKNDKKNTYEESGQEMNNQNLNPENGSDQNQQTVSNENIQTIIQQQIKELKSMAIILKQKFYEEKKSDFDQSIIEYTQQQKKLYQEKSEFEQANIQKTFSFNNHNQKPQANILSPKQEVQAIQEQDSQHKQEEPQISLPQQIESLNQNNTQPSLQQQQQQQQKTQKLAQNSNKSNSESQVSESESDEDSNSEDLQIEKLNSQNLLLENNNKRLVERINQLNQTIEKQLQEFNSIKQRNEQITNILYSCSFAQQQIYQVVQSAQVQIDVSASSGLITIQGNKIIIYDDINSEIKSSPEKVFQIYELVSIEYQKITIKMNFEKSLTLKIQFKHRDDLKQFDSILYIQRMKKVLYPKKPFFYHPQLPKADGVQARVIEHIENKSFSPIRTLTYNPDLNTSTSVSSSVFNTKNLQENQNQNQQNNMNILQSAYFRSSNEGQDEEKLKPITQSQQLNPTVQAQGVKKEIIQNENFQITKSPQKINSALKMFNQQRRSLRLESGKEFSFQPNKINSAEQFNNFSGQKINDIRNASKETSQETTEMNKNQINQQNVSILNDSNLNKSILSSKQKKNKKFVSEERLYEEAIDYLKKGENMIKHSKNGILGPKEKTIKIKNLEQLIWYPVTKDEKKAKSIKLEDIISIKPGTDSPGFLRLKKQEDNLICEDTFFYIRCKKDRRLELQAKDQNQRNTFIRHLQRVLNNKCKETYKEKPLFEDDVNESQDLNE